MAALRYHVKVTSLRFIFQTDQFRISLRHGDKTNHSLHKFCQRRPLSSLSNLSLTQRLQSQSSRSFIQQKWQNRAPPLCGFLATRFQSSDSTQAPAGSAPQVSDVAAGAPPVDYIPEPPAVPPASEFLEQVNALGEPTLQSVGLGGWSPSGLVQVGLEHLHVIGCPWWTSIMIGTLCLRLLIFPLVIVAQRNAANLHNHMPTVQKLQEKFSNARVSGNPMEAAKAGHELMDYMNRNKVQPMKNMLVPIAQVPIFLSVFFGIRQMANLPLESMKTGGLWWFTDLTVTDPYYLLPVLTCATLYITLELGVDGVRAASMSHAIRIAMRAMPLVIFPLILNFPTAMLCYWFTSNSMSLFQVMFLKIPAVRSFFKIPSLTVHPESALPKKKKFTDGFRDSWSNAKLIQRMEERQRMDAMNFKDAGTSPLQKTYPYDPTKLPSKPK